MHHLIVEIIIITYPNIMEKLQYDCEIVVVILSTVFHAQLWIVDFI